MFELAENGFEFTCKVAAVFLAFDKGFVIQFEAFAGGLGEFGLAPDVGGSTNLPHSCRVILRLGATGKSLRMSARTWGRTSSSHGRR